MVKLVYCLRRKPGLSGEKLSQYWRDVHAPLVAQPHAELLGIKRYVQVRTLDNPAIQRRCRHATTARPSPSTAWPRYGSTTPALSGARGWTPPAPDKSCSTTSASSSTYAVRRSGSATNGRWSEKHACVLRSVTGHRWPVTDRGSQAGGYWRAISIFIRSTPVSSIAALPGLVGEDLLEAALFGRYALDIGFAEALHEAPVQRLPGSFTE